MGFQGFNENRYLRTRILKGGRVQYDEWKLRGFEMNPRAPASTKNTGGFPKAVSEVLKAIKVNGAPYVYAFLTLVGENGEKVAEVTAQIVHEVQKANLLDTFNKPNFMVQDICGNGRLINNTLTPNESWGVYIHVYRTPGKHSVTEIYIGKAKDFRARQIIGGNLTKGSSHHKL